MKISKIKTVTNYILIILLLFYNCNPFFLLTGKTLWVFIFVLLAIITMSRGKNLLYIKLVLVLAISWLLIIIQGLVFQGFTPAAIYQPIMILFTPFLVYTIMGISYYRYLFNIIFFIAIYTSIIYGLQIISPGFDRFMTRSFESIFPYSWADWPRSILIYSAPRESGYLIPRNSGMFHEPGAYSIYLVFAIIINTMQKKSTFNKSNVFLSIVILTTFSTAGYIMLFVLWSYSIWNLKINIFLKSLSLVIFILISLTVYRENEFLQKKVNEQYKTQNEAFESGEIQYTGRFYFFTKSTNTFLSSPIFGRGILSVTSADNGKEGIVGLGFIGFLAKYGVFFGIFYMWYFFKGFSLFSRIFNISVFYTVLAFIVVNLGLLTQSFFFNIPFVLFFIIGLLGLQKKHPSGNILRNYRAGNRYIYSLSKPL